MQIIPTAGRFNHYLLIYTPEHGYHSPRAIRRLIVGWAVTEEGALPVTMEGVGWPPTGQPMAILDSEGRVTEPFGVGYGWPNVDDWIRAKTRELARA